MSGLYSPILAQAGFAKRKLASVIEWVAELDGLAQCWKLSEPFHINETDDYELGYTLNRYDSGNLLYLLSYEQGTESSNHRLAMSSGSPQLLYGLAFAGDRLDLTGQGKFTLKRTDGKTTASFGNSHAHSEKTYFMTIDRLGGPWSQSNNGYFKGWIKDFYLKINGIEVLRIPLTNKSQGANQLATVGNVNAFMPNYTNAVWKNKAELV